MSNEKNNADQILAKKIHDSSEIMNLEIFAAQREYNESVDRRGTLPAIAERSFKAAAERARRRHLGRVQKAMSAGVTLSRQPKSDGARVTEDGYVVTPIYGTPTRGGRISVSAYVVSRADGSIVGRAGTLAGARRSITVDRSAK